MSTESLRPRWPWILPLLAFLLVWAPTFPSLGSRFLGWERVDHYGTQWFYGFAELVMRGEQNPLHTDLFFFPFGKDIYGHTGSNVLDAVAAVPLRVLLGPVAGYNVFLLLSLIACAAAGAWTVRRVGGDTLAQAAAATTLFLHPYVVFEAADGRPTQAILIFLVLFCGLLLGLGKDGARPVLAGVFLGLAGWQYWFYGFFGGVVGLISALLHIRDRRAFRDHVITGAVSALMVLPGALPMLLSTGSGEVPGLLHVQSWDLTATPPVTNEGQLIALQIWSPLSQALGFWVSNLSGRETLISHYNPFPWPALLALGVAAWKLPNRRVGMALLLVGVAVSLGPLLIYGHTANVNPLYLGLVKALSFARRLWWPARAIALLTILLSFLGLALQPWPRLRLATLAIVFGSLILDLRSITALPAPSWDATIPAGYRCLAEGPPGAIIELPHAYTQAHLYYQTAHWRPISGGMLEDNAVFSPEEATSLRENNTMMALLTDAAELADGQVRSAAPEDKQALYDLGYRYVVLQMDAFRVRATESGLPELAVRTRLREIRQALDKKLGPAIYADGRVVLWSPWGAPAPCDLAALVPDKRSTNIPGVAEGALTRLTRKGADPEQVYNLVKELGGDLEDAARPTLADPVAIPGQPADR